jgi:hypothetical protein
LVLKEAQFGLNVFRGAMPITLPDLKNTHCVSLTACGEIITTDKTLLKWLKSEAKSLVADLDNCDGQLYATAGLGEHTGKHFHLDVTNKSYDPKKPLSHTRNVKLGQFQKTIEKLIGKEVLVDLRGLFEIKTDELPEGGIIRSLFFETKGDVAIKLKGAKLSIKGAPVNEMTWQLAPSGKAIRVFLEAENLKIIVSENYLTDALVRLENALKVFVLGKIPNEPK